MAQYYWLKDFKQRWLFNRGLTVDLLLSSSDSNLQYKVVDNMGTLGHQFRHLLRVDDQFISAIETGKVENNRRKLDRPIEKSQSEMVKLFKESEQRLFKLLDSLSPDQLKNLEIDWSYWKGENVKLQNHLYAMIDHDILHHGEIIVYFFGLNKKFPESWKAWGI